MNTMIRMLIATTMVTALAACNFVEDEVTKEEAQRTPLTGWDEDYCAANDWYGDGTCDDFCPEEDTDCTDGDEWVEGDEVDGGEGDAGETPTCQPDDCDVIPAIARICDDGSTGDPVCRAADDGECAIAFVCPEDTDSDGSGGGSTGGGNDGGTTACTDDACGPQPALAPVCEDGSTGELVCEATGDDECGWVGSCPPSSDACTQEECGPAPGAAPMCDNGSTGQYECSRGDDGVCGYQLVCACDDGACGPAPGAPAQVCDDGSTAGPRCVSIDGDACGWNFTECPE